MAAKVARCLCGFEMTAMSRMGAKRVCRDRRTSTMLLGTRTTRLCGSFAGMIGVPVIDDELVPLSTKVAEGP